MKSFSIQIFFVLLLSLAFHFVSAEDQPVVLGSGEWPPFISQQLPSYGVMSAIVSAAFKRAGREVEYEFHHWARTEELVKDGELAASLGYVKTQQRMKYFHYSERPIYTTQQAFFHLEGRPIQWEKFSDLMGYKIGITKGYAYGGDFMEAVEAELLDTYEVNNEIQGMKMLAAGRLDLFICDLDVGQQLLRSLSEDEQKEIMVNPNLLHTTDVFVILSKKHPESVSLLKKFNAGLKALYADGEYHRIIQSSGLASK